MALTVEQAKKLLAKHDDLKDKEDSLELFRRSYVGGSEYRDGDYLIRHEKEKKRAYHRRVKEAVYTNYCAPIVDIFSSYLFRERPQRSLGAGSDNDPAMSRFLNDADMRGRSFAELMREVAKWASVFGYMGIITDKPVSDTAPNRATELANDVRPYISYYAPTSIINWKFSSDYIGPPRLSTLVLKEQEINEDESVYKIWTETTWELWVIRESKGREQEPEFIMEGENRLGAIPFTLVVNKDAFDEMSGVSDLTDIAEINRYIYRIDSMAYEVIAGTAFPFLEVPVDQLRGPSNEDVVVGTGNVLERDVNDRVGHRWIEPAHASLGRIMEWRNQAVQDIREIAKMGGAQSTSRQGSAAFSGVAMEVKFQQLNAVLAAKATSMEHAEESILRYALMWENKNHDNVSVRYPRKFGIRDVVTDLDSALRAKSIIFSPEYDKLVQKSLASRSLSDLGYSGAVIEDVKKDIDNMPYVPAPQMLQNVGGMNGTSVIQTKEQVQAMQAAMAAGNAEGGDSNPDRAAAAAGVSEGSNA